MYPKMSSAEVGVQCDEDSGADGGKGHEKEYADKGTAYYVACTKVPSIEEGLDKRYEGAVGAWTVGSEAGQY